MVRPERRLLYSGITDWFDGVGRFFTERNRPLRLSWAGIGYYQSLLRVPAFLQWSFDGVEAIDDTVRIRLGARYDQRNVLEYRIEAALVGFECLVVDEVNRLKSAWPKISAVQRRTHFKRHEPDDQNVVLKIFFDTIAEFVRTLVSHAANIRNMKARYEYTIHLAERWLESGKKWALAHYDMFGDPSSNELAFVWQFEMDRAKARFDRIVK